MSSKFECISGAYDFKLIALAISISVGSSFAVFALLARIFLHRTLAVANTLLLLCIVIASADIWATHFICMLAYHPAVSFGVSAHITFVSLILLLVAVSMAFCCIVRTDDSSGIYIGGTILGLSIIVMHYADVIGSHNGQFMVWSWPHIALSIGIALSFTVSALLVFGQGSTLTQCVGAATLLSTGIVTAHFTSMSAMRLLPGSSAVPPKDLLSGSLIGYGVVVVTSLIVGSGLVTFWMDLQAGRENDRRLKFLARHDKMTGLPNRTYFEEMFEREAAAIAGANRSAALICLDLDGFKLVNDTFGHMAGDLVLIEAAERLRASLGERSVAARLGGDEFAILYVGARPGDTAAAAAETILRALQRSFVVGEASIEIGCSIGVALYAEHGTSYPVLLARADLALSSAKGHGRGTIRVFDIDMENRLKARTTLTKELKNAIALGQLELAYQPKTYVKTGRVSGFEALLRWRNPQRGFVSPAEFIPIAEESGLIIQIGEWVLREACREAATWDNLLQVAVNFSPAQFLQSELVDVVRRSLADSGLDPHRLEIEITESLFFDDTPRALRILGELQAIGVSVAMDDFGTGFSCLSTLKSFEFDTIKIDKSFIDTIGQSARSTSLVTAIIQLAKVLNMNVVAEGVEKREQLDFLARQGCDQIQGFLLGAPHPIAAYAHMLTSMRAEVA